MRQTMFRWLMVGGSVLLLAACGSATQPDTSLRHIQGPLANEQEYTWNCSGVVIRTGADPNPPREDCVLVSGGGEH